MESASIVRIEYVVPLWSLWGCVFPHPIMKIWSPTLIQTHACKICQEDLMRSSEWIRTSPKEPLAFEPANKHCICLTNAVDGVNHFLLLSKINRWCGNVDGTYYKSGQWRWKTWCAHIIHVLCVRAVTRHTYANIVATRKPPAMLHGSLVSTQV